MKHTPGRWSVVEPQTSQSLVLLCDDDPSELSDSRAICSVMGDRREGNAMLIAAAPRMLEALEQMQIALACFRDGQHYIHPVHGPLGFEELKYLVVDTAINLATEGVAHGKRE
jgi:hypothetical protein